MAPGSGKDYPSSYGFTLSEKECAIADLFHQHVSVPAGVMHVHLHPEIPSQKLENAKSSFAPVSHGEAVLCLLDTTAFGSAKNGLVVTVRGLYWKNAGAPKSERRTYKVLTRVTVDTSFFGGGLRLEYGTLIILGGMNSSVVEGLANFLNGIIKDLKVLSLKRWYLGVGGAQQGPFDLRTIRKQMASGEIDPHKCLAWKKGMAAWLPFVQVPELAGKLQQPPPLPSEVPPPISTSAEPPPMTTAPSLHPSDSPAPRAAESSQQQEISIRQKQRLEDLRRRAEEAADHAALRKLEQISRERLAAKAEAFWNESATNPAMAEQCADCLSLLSSALDEIENALVQAEESQSFLTGLEDLYRKEDRKPN